MSSRMSQGAPLPLDEILQRARAVASSVLASSAARVDAEGRWPEEGLRALQSAGLGGLVVPVPAGGLGQGLLALVQTCEVLGRACPSTAICYGMHCVGSAVIAARATPFQEQAYLRPIAEGRHITTLALSEPGTGAHFYFPQTVLEHVEGGYRVRGTKSFVTNGGRADSYVVSTMAASPEAPPGRFSCVVLDAGAPGVRWKEDWKGFGMRGNSSRAVELEDVFIPADNLLGEDGDQIWYVFRVIAPYFLTAMSGAYLGVAAAAFDETIQHLSQRQYDHGGMAPGQQAVMQRELGILWRKIERSRRLTYFAATEGDAGGPDALTALCSARADIAECAVDAVNTAMTLCGGIGYRENTRLGQLLRDARAAHVMSPTTLILETWIGRALLGLPLLAE